MLLLWAVFSELSLGEFGELIATIDRRYLLCYFALNITALLVRGERYRLMLQTMQGKPIGRLPVLIVTAIRNAFVDMLPARLGEASYVMALHRYGVPVQRGLSSFGLSLLLDILVLTLVIPVGVALALIMDVTRETAQSWVAIGAAVVIAALLLKLLHRLSALCLFAASICNRVAARGGIFDRVFGRLGTIGTEVANEILRVQRQGKIRPLLFLTVLLRVAKYFSLYLVLLAVVLPLNVSPVNLPFLTSALAFVVAEAAASLPISGLMGFGAYEGAWSFVFVQVCEAACAHLNIAAVALAIHIVTQLTGYAVGIVALCAFFVARPRSANCE